MTGYKQVNLKILVEEIGEDKAKAILSNFSCPLNLDVEHFLRYKAIEFVRQGTAATHLVFASFKDELVLVGYYTLAQKFFIIQKSSILSRRLKDRVKRFGVYNSELRSYVISAPLIAQLGKNFQNGYNKLITGQELLKMACDRIKDIQLIYGGKVAYLECEDKACLVDFYKSYGFAPFNKRLIEADEQEDLKGEYLVQMLKFFDS